MSICKLCLQDKKLIKKSHIIPDFLYRHSGMYNEQHKIYSFTLSDLLDGKKTRMISTGEYEGNILCAECDGNIIGSYENYVQKLLFGGLTEEPLPICHSYFNDKGEKLVICENVDYKSYKLFLLSLLWRMSISSRQIFTNIKVDTDQEEELRKMILNRDPKAFFDFPTYTGHFINDKTVPIDIIVQPVQFEEDGKVILILPGFLYVFEIGSFKNVHEIDELRKSTINEQNTVVFLELEDGMTWKFIKKISGILPRRVSSGTPYKL